MLASMCISIAFMIVDTCSVLNAFSDALPQGIEPFWKVRPLILRINTSHLSIESPTLPRHF